MAQISPLKAANLVATPQPQICAPSHSARMLQILRLFFFGGGLSHTQKNMAEGGFGFPWKTKHLAEIYIIYSYKWMLFLDKKAHFGDGFFCPTLFFVTT